MTYNLKKIYLVSKRAKMLFLKPQSKEPPPHLKTISVTPLLPEKESFLRELSSNISIQNLLIVGYRSKFYYWESIVMLRKLFIILVSFLKDYLDTKGLCGIISSIFLIFFFINEVKVLYESANLKYFESLSLIIVIASMNLGLMSSFKDTDSLFKMIFLLCIGLLNIFYVVFWIRSYLQGVKQKIDNKKKRNTIVPSKKK